jgi:predicted nucleic acid-binding protein
MARETFIDTSGFYSLLVGRDDQHKAAERHVREARRRRLGFVTTDYVLDETVTLLVARGHGHLVEPFLESTLKSQACIVEWMHPERFSHTADFLLKHLDQGWSFTDCVSFQVMKQRRLREALTKDEHFETAGFVALLRAGR